MDAVYDRNGDAIGWISDDVLYDTNDHYRAVIIESEIYQLGTSAFLGRFERGFIWDRNGMVVACLEKATPPPEIPDLKPPPPEIELDRPSDLGVAQRSGGPIRYTDRWSQRTWVRFLDGQ
jgi:hypothetical protein